MKRIVRQFCAFCSHWIFAQSKKISFDPSTLSLTWGVIENNHNGEMASFNELALTNKGRQALPDTGWKIYFNFVRDIREEGVTGNVEIGRSMGIFSISRRKRSSKSLGADKSIKIDFVSSDWVVNFTDAPSGFYLVWDGPAAPRSHQQSYHTAFYAPKQVLAIYGDKVGLITPANLYAQNKTTTDLAADKLVKIFPTPVEYRETGAALF